MTKELSEILPKKRNSVLTMKRIEAFFKKNPYSTQQACAKELDLHYVTVSNHVKRLRQKEK